MVIHTHKKKPVLFFWGDDIQPEIPPLTSEMAQTCEISHINVLNVTHFRSYPIIPHICWNVLMYFSSGAALHTNAALIYPPVGTFPRLPPFFSCQAERRLICRLSR